MPNPGSLGPVQNQGCTVSDTCAKKSNDVCAASVDWEGPYNSLPYLHGRRGSQKVTKPYFGQTHLIQCGRKGTTPINGSLKFKGRYLALSLFFGRNFFKEPYWLYKNLLNN